MGTESQKIPVRLYRSRNQIVLASPMPGLEPGDIEVTISGRLLSINGVERGPRQHGLDLIRAEWTIGPYEREIELPENVNGRTTNATYGNGVLVISLPLSGEERDLETTRFKLRPTGLARGERVGHTGQVP